VSTTNPGIPVREGGEDVNVEKLVTQTSVERFVPSVLPTSYQVVNATFLQISPTPRYARLA
jgi:hypothetical protein